MDPKKLNDEINQRVSELSLTKPYAYPKPSMTDVLSNLTDQEINQISQGKVWAATTASDHGMDSTAYANFQAAMRQREADMQRMHQDRELLASYQKHYIKLRTENIALDHESTIQLIKMIETEAATLKLDDFR